MTIYYKILRKIDHALYGLDPGVHARYHQKSDRLQIRIYPTYEDRSVKTAKLLLDGFYYARSVGNHFQDFDLLIDCSDALLHHHPVIQSGAVRMAYMTTEERNNVLPIPDFSFGGWKECGITDYDHFTGQIVKASMKAPIHDTLFWIGANTHPSREKLCEMSKTDHRIEAYMMSWERKKSTWDEQDATKYVSLIDHTNYKYLIDIQGHGWSARTKFLMFSGRPLFLAERKWHEYWYRDIRPYTHYIPVKEDLSDLTEQLDWAQKNELKAAEIAKNAQRFAQEHLTREAAVKEMADILLSKDVNK